VIAKEGNASRQLRTIVALQCVPQFKLAENKACNQSFENIFSVDVMVHA